MVYFVVSSAVVYFVVSMDVVALVDVYVVPQHRQNEKFPKNKIFTFLFLISSLENFPEDILGRVANMAKIIVNKLDKSKITVGIIIIG